MQKEADIMHQQRQVQVQRAKEWLEVAQKVQVAFQRLINLFSNDFFYEFYDTVLESSGPLDPVLEKMGKQAYHMVNSVMGGSASKLTPQMLEKIENDENHMFIDGGSFAGVSGAHTRTYARNIDGVYASCLFQVGIMKSGMPPYIRLFRESLLETMAAEPSAPLARRFRMFVEHQLMPAMAELAELLHESGTLLEWPSTEEMLAMFPYDNATVSREMLMFLFRSHYQSWCGHAHVMQRQWRLTRGACAQDAGPQELGRRQFRGAPAGHDVSLWCVFPHKQIIMVSSKQFRLGRNYENPQL